MSFPDGEPNDQGRLIDPTLLPKFVGGSTTSGNSLLPKLAFTAKRFHGIITLGPTRVGRDAGRIADEVVAHLFGLVGARIKVMLEIEAKMPDGAPDNIMGTVTENSRTLKFMSHGFESD